jgi:hypothetical protein
MIFNSFFTQYQCKCWFTQGLYDATLSIQNWKLSCWKHLFQWLKKFMCVMIMIRSWCTHITWPNIFHVIKTMVPICFVNRFHCAIYSKVVMNMKTITMKSIHNEHEGYHKLQQNMNHLNSHHTHKVNTYKDPNDHNMKNWNTKWNEQDYDAKLYFN